MENNSTNNRLRTWLAIAKRPESWPVEILFLFAIGTVANSIVEGTAMLEAINASWMAILNLAGSPFAMAASLILAPLLFMRGVRKVSEANRLTELEVAKIHAANNASQQEVWRAETFGRNEAARLQIKMYRAEQMGRDLHIFRMELDKIKTEFDLLEKRALEFAAQKFEVSPQDNLIQLEIPFIHLTRKYPFFDIPDQHPGSDSIIKVAPEFSSVTPDHPGSTPRRSYDPDTIHNIDFQAQLRRNFSIRRQKISHYEQSYQRAETAVEHQNNTLKNEMAKYGAE